ncbi:hypothetical protein AAA799P11_00730 [Marine Group I thaumarchaeote SCGC AAA799-P11]|uniref:Uncharacterized protein n=1 Tax=Marine Group I thaumarchaeote SCGC AAA799-P11 TaxID=1502295 RepID=A0A087S1C5_9ARCH|nr:hypothetical protein AAA799P11_00730 [Marine Group I thaumarchaeote SCGC AAA799-P11]
MVEPVCNTCGDVMKPSKILPDQKGDGFEVSNMTMYHCPKCNPEKFQ